MYFDNFKTEHECKERFRLLAKRLHPDHGGDAVVMAEIIDEYEKFLSGLKKKPEPKTSYRNNYSRHFQSDNQSKIDMIYEWSKKNEFFDLTFIDSLSLRLNSGLSLTPKQQEALEKIITNFNIRGTNE